jgi:hypothetical protein
MELDKALGFAVILGWDDLKKVSDPCSARVEYRSAVGTALALDFILMNQDPFTRPTDACPEGLALVYPPSGDERTEAATWMSGVHGAATNVSRPGNERAAAL